MSQSVHHQFIHLIWATKNTEPLISHETAAPLFAYQAGIIKKLGGRLLTACGMPNHIHLLINAPVDLALAELVCRLKSGSSSWYQKTHTHLPFNWNEGYSAFTVSPTSIDRVIRYFNTHERRHERSSFADELMTFLKIQEIEYNLSYVTKTTYTKLIYHLVWSVKNREALLASALQNALHQHMHQNIMENGGKLHAIGNVADHIHLLVEISSKLSMTRVVQKLKTTSTYLIRSQAKCLSDFCWQKGYGVFSVGMPSLQVVAHYVNNQEEHHKNQSFEHEWNWLIGNRVAQA